MVQRDTETQAMNVTVTETTFISEQSAKSSLALFPLSRKWKSLQ